MVPWFEVFYIWWWCLRLILRGYYAVAGVVLRASRWAWSSYPLPSLVAVAAAMWLESNIVLSVALTLGPFVLVRWIAERRQGECLAPTPKTAPAPSLWRPTQRTRVLPFTKTAKAAARKRRLPGWLSTPVAMVRGAWRALSPRRTRPLSARSTAMVNNTGHLIARSSAHHRIARPLHDCPRKAKP